MNLTIALPDNFTDLSRLQARLETAISGEDFVLVYCNKLSMEVFQLLYEKHCNVTETKHDKPDFLIAFWDGKEGEVKEIINECMKKGVKVKIINEG